MIIQYAHETEEDGGMACMERAEAISGTGSWDYSMENGSLWISMQAARILRIERPANGRISGATIPSSIPGWDHIRAAIAGLSGTDREFDILVGTRHPPNSGQGMINIVGARIPARDGRPSRITGILREVSLPGSILLELPNQFRAIMNTTGLESLDRTCETISAWLDADCVMVGEVLPGGEEVSVLSMILDGQRSTGHTYSLHDTPCANVAERGFCLYPDHAAEIFPQSRDLVQLGIQGYLGTPLRNHAGETIGILCAMTRHPLHPEPVARICIDLIALKIAAEIERRRAEAAIHNSERLLAESMAVARMAAWEYDPKTARFSFDDRFYSLYGTDSAQEGTRSMPAEVFCREFIHPDDRAVFIDRLAKIARSGSEDGTVTFEHRIIRRDAEIRDIIVRAGVFWAQGGSGLRIQGSDQDITELKRAERALVQANRKINLFSSVTRHDILNQITLIRGNLRHAGRKQKDPEQAAFLTKLDGFAGRIQYLIEFTRVYKDLGCETPRWFSLDEILPEIPESVRLESSLPEVRIYADPIISRVFAILLDNSLRHGKHVSTIRISLAQDDGMAMLRWEDDGIGIPPEAKESIFEHGYGTDGGLGLFLAREILGITGIAIRETGISGRGACFEIAMPEGTFR